MARLQSSPLLRKNHGNASNTDPDGAAPYPEFPLLLLSADTQLYTVGPKEKKELKNWFKKKNKKWQSGGLGLSCQNYWLDFEVPTQVAAGWLETVNLLLFLDPAFAQTTAKTNRNELVCFLAPRLEEWVISWRHSGPYLVLLQASCSVNKRILLPCATSHFYFLCSVNGCGRESRHSDYGLASWIWSGV